MRLRYVSALAIQLIALAAWAQTYALAFPANGRFVLPTRVAAELLQQCSRPTPQGATGYWEPTQERIEYLETLLKTYLLQLSEKGAEVPPRGIAYHRQYIGFVKDRTLYIYGSFYPGREDMSSAEARTPFMICDGGAANWGIVYDVADENFEELRFNGPT